MKIGIALSEPSTQRGLVMLLGGGAALYNALSGGHINVDDLMHRAETWLAIAATIAGALGVFVKDNPSTTAVQVPPVEIVERQQSADTDSGNGFGDK